MFQAVTQSEVPKYLRVPPKWVFLFVLLSQAYAFVAWILLLLLHVALTNWKLAETHPWVRQLLENYDAFIFVGLGAVEFLGALIIGHRLWKYNHMGFTFISRIDPATGTPMITHVTSLPLEQIRELVSAQHDTSTKIIIGTTKRRQSVVFHGEDKTASTWRQEEERLSLRVVPDPDVRHYYEIVISGVYAGPWVAVSLPHLFQFWDKFNRFAFSQSLELLLSDLERAILIETKLELEEQISAAWQARFEETVRIVLAYLDALADPEITRPSDAVRDYRMLGATKMDALLRGLSGLHPTIMAFVQAHAQVALPEHPHGDRLRRALLSIWDSRKESWTPKEGKMGALKMGALEDKTASGPKDVRAPGSEDENRVSIGHPAAVSPENAE